METGVQLPDRAYNGRMAANRGSALAHGSLVVLSIALFCLAATALANQSIAFSLGLLAVALVAAALGLQLRPRVDRAEEGRLLAASWLFFGLLTLIFTPIYAGQPSGNRKIWCLSNIKQLGTAMAIYASDYDERYPLAASWHEELGPYTKNEDLFHCSVATSPWSYAMNASMAGTHEETIKDPTFKVLLFEANAALPSASGGREWLMPRHTSGERPVANIGFLDGHAKAHSAETAAQLFW